MAVSPLPGKLPSHCTRRLQIPVVRKGRRPVAAGVGLWRNCQWRESEILNTEMLQEFAISPERVDAIVQHERELERRERLYRGTCSPLSVNGQSVVVVDDGIATGATMLAVVEALRHSHPAEIIIAVPVAPPQTCKMLRIQVERVVCTLEPTYFDAVGSWYAEFPQVSDEEVRAILAEAELESHMRG